MSNRTKSNMEILGNILFYLILIGLPLIFFELSFRGSNGSNFLEWWLSQSWYRIIGIGILIFLGIVVYLLIMNSFKMAFEHLWFKVAKAYDSSREWYNKRRDKKKNEKQNGSNNIPK